MIIAIKDKDRVVIGKTMTDLWARFSDKDYVDPENVAIRFSEKGYLFACSDANRSADIVLFDDDLINADMDPKIIVKGVIPYIREILKENGKPVEEDNWRNALVICNDEHLYDIGVRFGFHEVDDYVCHGYSVELITSVLDATKDLSPEERIVKAVSFANKIRKENFFPVVITDTKTKQFQCIYEGRD